MLPKRLILKAGDRIPDIYSGWGITLVSQAFREVIEEFDKDINQFVPVEIVLADGSPYPRQQFFYFQCRQPLNTIDPESHPTIKESVDQGSAGPENLSGLLIYRDTEGFSVFADRMNGAGIWREMRSPNYRFMSDALIARLKEKGCNGWDIRPHFNEV
ncbi:imm11 family protein [Halovulum sp. GXIMD14793]